MENPTLLRPADRNFSALMQAPSWDKLTDIAQDMLTSLEVDSFMKKMKIADGNGRSHLHIVSSLAPALTEQFRQDNEDAADPITRHVSCQGIPLAWDIDQLCRDAPASPYRALRESGIRAGMSIAARSEQSFSRIDIYTKSTAAIARQQLCNDLLLFAFYLNEAARTLWFRQSPRINIPVLTSRERQCLRWSASGKTSNEIGAILGISQNTVYFHLKKAASKFEVYGTRHAISRALEMGLI